jgi:two-component system, chemotaxis family, chemotaxis protein CheY
LARKILLADDSVTAQNMGRRILSDAGYEVITVNNGSAALKKIAESKPDLIILDVYMPGYGGLEVCQRLKEAQETARIPVLLSVGKLEPFKVEESRRVRADGFIIKPFEASELLTALTKLEDKIVPEKESFKPGRFAKAIASAEQLSTTSAAVGEESGWKSRLTIPAATPKLEEVEIAESQPASAGLRETAQREESKSIAMKSAEVAAALPPGITAEELTALAVAANTFAGKNETAAPKTEEPEAAASEKPEIEVEAGSPFIEVAEAITLASAPPVQEEARKELQTPAQAAEMQRATTDAEVLAALASLSPTHIESPAPVEEFAGNNGGHSGAHRQEEQMGASGPRWIAQSVAIAEDESTLVLEREMEKAYAAMAALEEEKEQRSVAVEESNAPIVAEAVTTTESVSTTEISFSSTLSTEAEPSQRSQPAEPIPVPAAQTPAAAESVPEVSSPEAAAAERSSSAPESVNAVGETIVAVANENASYAAAASAGSGVPEQVESSPNVEAPIAVESTAPSVEAVPERESELAAAWQNWRHIRESILGSQLPRDISQAAAGLEAMPKHDPDADQPATEASSESGPSESATIANIVDSVLAELKPKLMEEISKKMKKDKKK